VFTVLAPHRAGGGDTVATFPYINTATGRQNHTVHLYMATVKLQPGKKVQLVTLPNISQGVSSGTNAMHVFAVTTGG
jgi:beta-glucosidase